MPPSPDRPVPSAPVATLLVLAAGAVEVEAVAPRRAVAIGEVGSVVAALSNRHQLDGGDPEGGQPPKGGR